MADAEVGITMEDVVVVDTGGEEGDHNDVSKTQVILQLQPITQGVGEEGAETTTVVTATETHQEIIAEEEVEFGYPITCGESKAVLLFKKFVCPGINVKCVKYDDQLISPKQFVHLAGKATLKDWKRAIRLGGVMLRKMMDSRQIDFYQHDTVCTNTCRSTKFDLLISNTRLPLQGSEPVTPATPQVGNGGHTIILEESTEEAVAGIEFSPKAVPVAMETESKRETEDISEETLNFWKGIADVGLMGEVVANIRTELLELLTGVQQRSTALQEPDIAVLSSFSQVFGLLDSVKRVLDSRRCQTDPSQEQVLCALTGLEQQLEEQKKQAQDWRARSRALHNMVSTSAAGGSKPPPKRPRLQRPVSAGVLSVSSSQQQQSQLAQQFTVLSPITLSPVGQPFTVAGLPMASLGQQPNTVTLHTLPAGSQFITRYATNAGKADTITLHPASSLTLLSAAAVRDSSQLGTIVSPMELVHVAAEDEMGGAGVEAADTAAHPYDGEVVDGVGLEVKDQEEGEVMDDEGQAHTTVIEIDPAPGDHAEGVIGLQLSAAAGAGEEGGVVMQGEMEVMGEGEEGTVVVQGEMEVVGEGESTSVVLHGEVEEVHMEPQGQLHNVQIVVIEEEAQEEAK